MNEIKKLKNYIQIIEENVSKLNSIIETYDDNSSFLLLVIEDILNEKDFQEDEIYVFFHILHRAQKNTRCELESYNRIVKEMMLRMKSALEDYEKTSPFFLDLLNNIDINEWWNQAYPIIEQIATVTGAMTGVATIIATPVAFIKWVRSKFQQKEEKAEYSWVKYILNEDEWHVDDLANKLCLSHDEAKSILKGFGYVYNRKDMLYKMSEYTLKLRNIKSLKKLC